MNAIANITDLPAGQGKSRMLASLRETYEASGGKVIGLAPTNSVVADLQTVGFSSAHTIHSALAQIERGDLTLDDRTLIVVDEVGLVEVSSLRQIVGAAEEAGATVRLFGDDSQLPPTTTQSEARQTPQANRGAYDEILRLVGVSETPQQIISRFAAALPGKFVAFDRKSRGDALNHDLYGYDPEQDVAVIQIRHAFRRYRDGYLNVHKDYVLVGRNEITGLPFRHPVSATAIRAGIRADRRDPAAAVRAAQRWMWGVSDKQLTKALADGCRQGDVLLVAERGKPAAAKVLREVGTTYILGESHEVRAAEVLIVAGKGDTEVVWARDPALWHAKGQHDPIWAPADGWYSVRIADEAATWSWGTRLGD